MKDRFVTVFRVEHAAYDADWPYRPFKCDFTNKQEAEKLAFIQPQAYSVTEFKAVIINGRPYIIGNKAKVKVYDTAHDATVDLMNTKRQTVLALEKLNWPEIINKRNQTIRNGFMKLYCTLVGTRGLKRNIPGESETGLLFFVEEEAIRAQNSVGFYIKREPLDGLVLNGKTYIINTQEETKIYRTAREAVLDNLDKEEKELLNL